MRSIFRLSFRTDTLACRRRTTTSKRAKFAEWVERAGLLGFLEYLAKKPAIYILTHHRIGHPSASDFDHGVFTATAEQFDHQVALLKDRYPILSLNEMQYYVDHPERLSKFSLMLTFDDGCVDNFDEAFPILKAHGVTATFFLPTALIGTHQVPWWDQIAFLVRRSSVETIALDYPKPAHLSLRQPDRAIRRLLRLYQSTETVDAQRFIQNLELATRVELRSMPASRVFMNWEEVKQMSDQGMDIASHTHSHPLLSKLSLAQQSEELGRSKQEIRDRLGIETTALAYPVGRPECFNADTYKAMERTGYKTAFSLYGGLNIPGHFEPHNLRRVEPSPDVPLMRLQTALAGTFGGRLLEGKDDLSEWAPT